MDKVVPSLKGGAINPPSFCQDQAPYSTLLNAITPCQPFTENQKWKLLGAKIDYLQHTKILGFCPQDPLENLSLDPVHRLYLDALSSRLFSELNLMISGWEVIKEAVISNHREFPFDNPRELFAERCRQEAIFNIQFRLNNEANSKKTEAHYKILNAFYQNRLKEPKKAHMLEAYKKSEYLAKFFIYAIWDYKDRTSSKLGYRWCEFCSAFKSEAEIVSKESLIAKLVTNF